MTPIWRLHNGHGPSWKYAQAQINSETNYQVHSCIWSSLLHLVYMNKPDFSTKKLLRSYPKRQKFLVIFWNNLVPSYMQGINVMIKWNYGLKGRDTVYSMIFLENFDPILLRRMRWRYAVDLLKKLKIRALSW